MVLSSGRILCFGDSNTYGFDPRDPFGDRYPPSARWPEILAERTGLVVVNMGLNGRTIPHTERETDVALTMLRNKLPADLVIIMLGSNDAFQMYEPTVEKIAARMDIFLHELKMAIPGLRVFLISPPPVDLPFSHIRELFPELIKEYRRLAEKYDAIFAGAPEWDLPLAADGVHFSPKAHKEFALQVKRRINQA